MMSPMKPCRSQEPDRQLINNNALDTLQHSFQWSHVRQLDWLSRELLARAWQAGDGSSSTYLDSSICETFGPAKEGGEPPRPAPYLIRGLPHRRRYWGLLMSRLGKGRADTAAVLPSSAGDGGPGALRRGPGVTHGAG